MFRIGPVFALFLVLTFHSSLFSVPISDSPEQVIFVIPTPTSSNGILIRYEIKEGQWQKLEPEWEIKMGKSGIVLGSEKIEGDGATPAGEFPIERAYGYNKQSNAKIPYRKLAKKDIWVDEPKSKYYNQFVPGKLGKLKGKSVFGNPEIYRLFVVIEHNTKNIKADKGSMIFIHSWSDWTKPTYGCLGLKTNDLEDLFSWLDAEKKPVLFILKDGSGL